MTDHTPPLRTSSPSACGTVGWQGVDVFGPASRDLLDPVEATDQLAELGAAAVTFHDDDLLPEEGAREATLERFRQAFRRSAASSAPSSSRSSRPPRGPQGSQSAWPAR